MEGQHGDTTELVRELLTDDREELTDDSLRGLDDTEDGCELDTLLTVVELERVD